MKSDASLLNCLYMYWNSQVQIYGERILKWHEAHEQNSVIRILEWGLILTISPFPAANSQQTENLLWRVLQPSRADLPRVGRRLHQEGENGQRALHNIPGAYDLTQYCSFLRRPGKEIFLSLYSKWHSVLHCIGQTSMFCSIANLNQQTNIAHSCAQVAQAFQLANIDL